MEVMQILLEGAGALLLVLAVYFLNTVSSRLGELSAAVAALRLEIAKEYLLKTDFNAHRARVHELADSVQVMSNRVTTLEALSKK